MGRAAARDWNRESVVPRPTPKKKKLSLSLLLSSLIQRFFLLFSSARFPSSFLSLFSALVEKEWEREREGQILRIAAPLTKFWCPLVLACSALESRISAEIIERRFDFSLPVCTFVECAHFC